ncbi:hypothetical protein [Kitasatospora purpeofusca]|uniref:hypothetical protein n=1 Tax=Kitasatospora purpeofusca TaxID=67352 RepID=UPI0036D2AA6D
MQAWLNRGTDMPGDTGAPGGGGWQAMGTVAAGVVSGSQVRSADFDGDGKADYIVIDDEHSVKA